MHKQIEAYAERLCTRFRGFLPVVVDVETGGFDARHDALLEIAAVTVSMDGDGVLTPEPVVSTHVEPFPGSHIDPKSLEITGIDPDQPLGGLAYGQTVLSRAVQAAGYEWNANEAHSAVYDAERTAALFCTIANRWR